MIQHFHNLLIVDIKVIKVDGIILVHPKYLTLYLIVKLNDK